MNVNDDYAMTVNLSHFMYFTSTYANISTKDSYVHKVVFPENSGVFGVIHYSGLSAFLLRDIHSCLELRLVQGTV